MKFSDICEKIKSGEFTIDTCGHKVNDPKEYILRLYEHTLQYANGAGDGKWDKDKKNPSKNWDADMRECYQRDLDRDLKIASENESPNYALNGESYCFKCGETLKFSFNGNGLSVNVRFNRNLNKSITEQQKQFFGEYMGGFELYNCEYSNRPPCTVKIDVTDRLIFANWIIGFEDDAPEGKQYFKEFELNSLRGRIGIAEWKAKNQNVAYTQVHGGSTSIWINKDKNHGYICSGYIDENDDFYDEEKQKYILPEFLKEYEKVGKTDVTVWRVEMADSAKVDLAKIKEKWDYEDKYPDSALVEVQKGRWSLTSHYDVPHNLSKEILAEIKLVA